MRQRSTRVTVSLAPCLTAFLLFAAAAAAQERATALQLSAGVFDFSSSRSPSQLEAEIELRVPTRWWKLDAAGGAAITEEGSAYLYGGLRRDVPLGPRIVLAPGLGIVLYEQGDGKDLGGTVQFRTALDIGYRWTRKARLGVTLYHISNAGLHDLNPGADSAVLTYSVALR